MNRGEFCRLSVSAVAGVVAGGSARGSQKPADASHPVPLRKLGSTGELVSMLGLGGSHIGDKKKLTDAQSTRLMRAAVDGGITFFDNCWDYNQGLSEERMGKALGDGYRKRVFLMTKLDGRTGKAATAQLEQSLTRLKTDVIDMVQVHEVIRMSDPERSFAPDGIMNALQKARKAGKLRYIGFTGHKDPAMHLAMLRAAEKANFVFDAVQMPLNVMDAHYRSFEQHVLPVLEKQGIGVLGMKALGAGDILQSGVVTAQECLRYALSLPTSVVITGIDSDNVLQQNLNLARNFVPLSPSERSSLLARTALVAKNGKHELFKTGTTYDGTVKHPHWLETAKL